MRAAAMHLTGGMLISDQEILLEYCEKGNERVITDFVRKYQNMVYTTALRYVGNHFDADDIAQDVFIKAVESLKKFRGDSSLKSWLYRITVNHCLNFKKKKNPFSFLSQDDDETHLEIQSDSRSPEELYDGKILEKDFLEAISKLPEKQRETFALRYFEELSYDEISKLLDTSVGGLKANYYQAVKKLATYLKQYKV